MVNYLINLRSQSSNSVYIPAYVYDMLVKRYGHIHYYMSLFPAYTVYVPGGMQFSIVTGHLSGLAGCH